MPARERLVLSVVLLAISIAFVALALTERADALPYDLKFLYRDCGPPVLPANGLNPLSFNYTLKNTGDLMSEEVVVEFKSWPLLWQYFLTTTTEQGIVSSTTGSPLELLLQKGEVAPLSVTITPSREQPNTTFWFTMKAYPKREPAIVREQTLGVIIPQYAAFEIRVWNDPGCGYTVMPPSQVTLRFALFNKGNGMDRFYIQYESSRNDAGWILEPMSGIDEYGFTQNITPDPGRQHPYFIDMRLPVPADEKADITCQVTVTAMSLFNQSLQMPPAFTTVRTLQYYDFSVQVDGSDRRDGIPGEQVEFALTISNRGNGFDIFAVKPTWSETDCPGFLATANPHSVKVASGGTEGVACIVVVPLDAARKIYFIGVEVSSSSNELASVTKTLEIDVGQFYAIALGSPQARKSAVPGDVLTYEVVVRNTGNGLDTMTVAVIGAPVGWTALPGQDSVVLLQREDATIVVNVAVPEVFEEAPIGSYNLTIKVCSSRSSAVAVMDLVVDIVQFYKIDWMYNGQPITDDRMPIAQIGVIRPRRAMNPYERNSIDVTLEVKNCGNGDDEVTLWGLGPDPRVDVTLSPTRTLLLRDQTKPVKVHIEVPLDLAPGVYSAFANATSRDLTRPMKAVPIDFEVFNLDASVPSVPTYNDVVSGVTVRPELTVDAREDLTFSLRVDNAGTKPVPSVLVRVYDVYLEDGQLVRWNFFNLTTPPIAVGDRFVVGEGPFSEDDPPLSWMASVPGEHTLEFRVFLDHQSRADDDVASVVVTVKEPPTPPKTIYGRSWAIVMVVVAAAILVAVGYTMVLRRRPTVDKDLYGSIYGSDFEEEAPSRGPEPDMVAMMSPETHEQVALYDQDLDGEDVDRVIEEPVDLDEDEVRP